MRGDGGHRERRHRRQSQAVAVVVACVAAVGTVVAQQKPPTFKSSADVIAVDVQVVARDGMPVSGLSAENFEVFIDGRRRPVQSAQFLRVAEPPPRAAKRGASPAPAPAEALSGDGRIFMIAVDQMSFPASAQQSAREAVRRVAASVGPNDYLGMMTFPGQVRIAPTRDRAAIDPGIAQVDGLRGDLRSRQFNLSASEAGLIKSNDPGTMAEVFERECDRRFPPDPTCKQEVRQEAAEIANALEQQGMAAVNGLHDVVDALDSVAGRKTLIVISAGIPISRKTGGVPNLDHELARISRRAAAANINLYVFYMNVHFLRYFSAEYGRQNHTIFDDITMFGYGLEKFADAAGGSFAQVEVDADPFVDRIMRETSAYYLLAVPTEARDREGKEHVIRVSLKDARGATAQYRKAVVVPVGK